LDAAGLPIGIWTFVSGVNDPLFASMLKPEMLEIVASGFEV
jgi:hypothetical protein